jgi:tetratricopeptide (TPR) repeat protein
MFLAGVLLVGSSRPLATPVARGVWLGVTTPDFMLFGEVPETRLVAIAARLEAFRGALERLHPGSRTSPRETFVYVFRNAESGWPFTPAPATGGHHLGVNPPYDVGNYVTVAAPFDDPPLEVLYHAYAHQFLDDNFPRLPLAVTEGLAEYDSGFAAAPEGTLIGLVSPDHVRWLRENAPLPLSELLSLDAGATLLGTANGREAFVSGSWALMHYLVSGSGEKRARLPGFLEALQRGTPAADAVLSVFGVSLEELQQEVTQYVRGNRFLAMRIGDATTAPDADAWRGRPMARDEVLAALGDLLGHAGAARTVEAEAYFQEALRLNPRQARAHAGLGYLRYSQNRFDESIPLFEQAIAIEPDAMSCYLLSRSLLKVNAASATATPSWLARSRDLLARAITLRPRFAAPYVTLGATHILPDGDVAAGIELLEKARVMLPARTDIAGNLVYLYLRQGDFHRAQNLVDTVLAGGGDEEILKKARAALATYQEHLAAKQSADETRPNAASEARYEAWRAKMVKTLRDELARTEDPATRARLEEALKHLERPSPALAYTTVVEIYNEAVDKANKRDYPGAIALLEDLLSKVEDPDLRQKIETLLERFRRDAVRLRQSVE